MLKERFPIVGTKRDMEQKRWLGEQQWYIYRMRFWEGEDIENFLSDHNDDDEEGVQWFGSNDPDRGYRLMEDRLCIQNDHCFGSPSLFLWTHDFCNEQGNLANAVKIRNYGVIE